MPKLIHGRYAPVLTHNKSQFHHGVVILFFSGINFFSYFKLPYSKFARHSQNTQTQTQNSNAQKI